MLDDEVVVHWYRRGGAKTSVFPQLSKLIAKFIDWLDEEDESEEDSGED